jgi:hypothetical protein
MPIFPVFAVSPSVDTFFAGFVLLYSLLVLDAVESDGASLTTARGIAAFVALSLLIIFCRNNGVLVVVVAGVALACVYRMKLKALYVALILVLGLTAIVQGPVYSLFNVQKPVVEALGIPIQQMAYVVVTRGDLTPADQTFLARLLPLDRWRLDYSPTRVDPIKGDPAFDAEFLATHTGQFLETWAGMLSRNPVAFVKAYLITTYGYWKPSLGPEAMPPLPTIAQNGLHIHRTDVLDRVIGRSLVPAYRALERSWAWRDWPNAVWAVWLALLSAAVLVSFGKARYAAALAPCLGSWMALMLAAPVAFAVRYLFMFFVCLPLAVLLPLVSSNGPARSTTPGEVAPAEEP